MANGIIFIDTSFHLEFFFIFCVTIANNNVNASILENAIVYPYGWN